MTAPPRSRYRPDLQQRLQNALDAGKAKIKTLCTAKAMERSYEELLEDIEAGKSREPVSLDPSVPYSVAQLAAAFDLPAENLRKRLDAFRKKNLEGYVEVPNARSRQPRFLFYFGAVQCIIDAMKTSGESPAKKTSSKTP